MSKLSCDRIELFTPDIRPFGMTYGQWTARWWQWVLSIPKTQNPLIDVNGQNCATNQSGPVWFLAATLQGSSRRACGIPSHKAVLFPVINVEASVAEGDGSTEEELSATSRAEIDQITETTVKITGRNQSEIRQYRIQSPLFNVSLPPDNILGLPAQVTNMISDGYWIFLKSLEPGSYNLSSFGSCRAGRIKIGVSYHLTVEN